MKTLADSEIAQTIDVTETEKYRRRYDAAAKKLVSQKAILAYILKSTMEEFQDVSVKQIAEELIEGTPEVSTIAVHQDTPDAPLDRKEQDGQKRMSGSDRIPVVSVENNSIREGTVRYDIHFKVCVPVVRLLSGLLSAKKTAAEKKKMLSEEFYIDMTEEIDQEVSSMCNLSEGIFEKGIEAGIARGMEAGIVKGREAGRLEVLFDLVRDGTLTISVAAEAAAMEPSEFEQQYNENLSQLR